MASAKKTATATRAEKDYDVSDVKRLMRVQLWRNYSEMITWLKREGDADPKLTPGEVSHLVEDLSRLKQRGTQFMTDPARLYEELKRR
jgi:hypothetical protein